MSPDAAVPDRANDDLPIRDFMRVLRRRLPIVLAISVLMPSAALTASLRSEKQYTATAELLFRDPGFDQRLFGSSILAPSQDPDREAATNATLVSLETIARRTSRKLRDPTLTPKRIRAKVTVQPEGRSNVVSVMATDRHPDFAARLANTMAQQYISFRREADRSKINGALALVQRQLDALTPLQRRGPDGRSVKQRVDQLQILASLQTGNAELVQPALPASEPSSPRTMRNTLAGLLIGMILGLAVGVLRDRLDQRLRHRSEAEAILQRPVLGTIPESRALRGSGRLGLELARADAEAFRSLRTNLSFFGVDQEVRSMLITSSAPGDGKSTIARYLAMTAAMSNVGVVLLEADLRRPTLRRAFSQLQQPGLTDVLAGHVPVADAIQRLPVSIGGDQDGGGCMLDVIVAGPPPPNPTDLLESERMLGVLAELEASYELVIIDSSPLPIVPDAVPLAKRVSGVAIVIRLGKSTTTGTRALHTQLGNLDVSPMGIIINGAPVTKEGGYYGYSSAAGAGASQGLAPASRWLRLRHRLRPDTQ